MLYLFRSWKESLALLLPSNFKLFFLVTLKGIIQAYKYLFMHFWWLLMLASGADFVYARYFSQYAFLSVVPLILWLLVFFVLYLIIRPSVTLKNFNYYSDYIVHFFYFAVISIFAISVVTLFIELANSIAGIAYSYTHSIIYYLVILPLLLLPMFISFLTAPDSILPYLSPFLSFVILFLLDSNGRITSVLKSLVRGFKMMWYNYPLCFLVFAFFLILSIMLQSIIINFFGLNSLLLFPIFPALLLPIPLCFLTNIYIKRVHDQFGIYYPETNKE